MRKEVSIVTLGSILGMFAMHVLYFTYDILDLVSYYTRLSILARMIGSSDIVTGFSIEISIAVIMGIVTGIILHLVFKLDISNTKNGILFGMFVGITAFIVFAIPVGYMVVGPFAAQVMVEDGGTITYDEMLESVRVNFIHDMLYVFIAHIVWGVVLGWISTQLTRRFGANYFCDICHIEFSNTGTLKMHIAHVHDSKESTNQKKILILGGGYAGVTVLNKMQKRFHDNVDISIGLVSESNFFLHTPMLPEMASGAIEARHIATPIRQFCYRAKFYQARVTKIDLATKNVTIKRVDSPEIKTLEYDYLVIAIGMRTNFYGNENIKQNAIAIRTLDDAIKIRNHVIGALEKADLEEPGSDNMAKLTTFVVVGGGFSGVETAGELNSFVRDSVRKYYHNIPEDMIRVILVSSSDGILPEVGTLGKLAISDLTKAGVVFHTNVKLVDYSNDKATLGDGTIIHTSTLVWAAGLKVGEVISNLDTKHHDSGRIIVNKHLSLIGNADVFVLGDCAYITDNNGVPYPGTAEHAMHEAKIVADNLTNRILGVGLQYDFTSNLKGSVAKIGSRDGVAFMMGREMHGIIAWFLWKHYYLTRLPTTEKKIRVGLDWLIDLFFPRDITRFSRSDK